MSLKILWTKEELLEVYFLFKEQNGMNLSESDLSIQALAEKLGKSNRSVELRASMFINLDTNGFDAFENVSKRALEIWKEEELSRSADLQEEAIELSDKGIEDDELEEESIKWNYDQWNEKLLSYFFENWHEESIKYFLITDLLFREVSEELFTYRDFEYSMKVDISGVGFERRFEEKLKQSFGPERGGSQMILRPKYFGYIIFILHCLNQPKAEDYNANNVYNKINDYAKEVVSDNWGAPKTDFARDFLEPAWHHLEGWSNKSNDRTSFQVRESSHKKYVSKLTLHTIFSVSQLESLLAILSKEGVVQGEAISNNTWIEIIGKNKEKIKRSKLLLEYLKEDSEISKVLFERLNSYFDTEYKLENYKTKTGGHSVSCPILMTIRIVQNGAIRRIEEIAFKLYSDDFEREVLEGDIEDIEIEHDAGGYSESFPINDFIPTFDGAPYRRKGKIANYKTKDEYRWFIKDLKLDHRLWIETLKPSFTDKFLIMGDTYLESLFEQENILPHRTYETEWEDVKVFYFSNLEYESFERIAQLTGKVYSPPSGKIDLISKFNKKGRQEIFINFKAVFKFDGEELNPELIAFDEETEIELVLLEESIIFTLPEDFPLNWKFKVKEKKSGIVSHRFYEAIDLRESKIENIKNPLIKDEDGHNRYKKDEDSHDQVNYNFDIPEDYGRKEGAYETLKIAQDLFEVFRPGKDGRVVKLTEYQDYDENHLGELLLQYLAVKPTRTNEFSELIRELDPTISEKHSKKILYFWRDLGYIHFDDIGSFIEIVPTSLFFVSTSYGLKGYLAGYRSADLVEKLKERCVFRELKLEFKSHFKENPTQDHDFEIIDRENNGLYPYRIFITQPIDSGTGEEAQVALEKFYRLKEDLSLFYLNDIRHRNNDIHTPYPLACFNMQRSVNEEFNDYIKTRKDYPYLDTTFKDVFNFETFDVWEETHVPKEELDKPTLVRFKGYDNKRTITGYLDNEQEKLIRDYGTVAFHLIDKDVLYKQSDPRLDKNLSDLYVPLNLKLPFWIERGLILMNAMVPEILKIETPIGRRLVRKYRNINDEIISYVGDKLNQEINNLKE